MIIGIHPVHDSFVHAVPGRKSAKSQALSISLIFAMLFILMLCCGCAKAGDGLTDPSPAEEADSYGAEYSVMDVYGFAKDALERDRRVLILFLDGFGYWSFEAALARGDVPNLATLEAHRAAAVMPTITPVNYAAMVTGRPPEENGVTDRSGHTVDCDTIFDYALSLGKTAVVIEGDVQILRFSVPQELNPDFDGDGDTDNEVFDCALSMMDRGYDLMLVHFHGIDDTGHQTGPDSAETREKIRQVDAYAGLLMEKWDGYVIAVADHGQHENDGNGDEAYADKRGIHGSDAESDVIIPLLVQVTG